MLVGYYTCVCFFLLVVSLNITTRTLTFVFLIFFSDMSTLPFDLYKGTSRKKRLTKTAGESSNPSAKKVRAENPATSPTLADPARKIPPTSPEVAVLETLQGLRTPPTQVAEGLRVEVVGLGHSLTQPSREPEKTNDPTVEAGEEDITKQVFEGVARMNVDRVDRLAKNRKYLKMASSFPNYNNDQAFTRGANDIVMVSFYS